MAGESPGRSESERTGGHETFMPWRPSLHNWDEGSMTQRRLAEAEGDSPTRAGER